MGGVWIIVECNEDDLKVILEYIGDDYGKCLYIFIDLKKYGFDDENFNIWIQYDDIGICGLITEYYGGIQIYSSLGNLIISELVEFIKEKDPSAIFGMKKILDEIHKFLPQYDEEIGIVGKLTELKYPPNKDVYSASVNELVDIVKMISDDENIGKPYGFESLYAQFYERKLNNFGRNFILRDKINNDIICHAGTYAELSNLAVIGGVMTSEDYRGKGFSKGTLSSLCNQLTSEGKEVFSYFYIPSAIKMHYGVGFEKIGDWAKLFK